MLHTIIFLTSHGEVEAER